MKRLSFFVVLIFLASFGFACSDDGAVSTCIPGQKKCDKNSIVTCMDNGHWGEAVACLEPNALCDASTLTCVAELSKCKVNEKICNGNTLLTCQADGTWDKGLVCKGATPICDSDTLACVAASVSDCEEGKKKCEGNTLHICKADGTWNAGVACTGETPICDEKTLQCVALAAIDCKTGEKRCSDNTLHICQVDGTWDDGLVCEGETPICDPETLACVAASVSDCEENDKKCEGNTLHICRVDGTWDDGLVCEGETPICDPETLACVAASAECEADEKKCEGNTLLTCQVDGTWDDGLDCEGETPLCDADLLECVASKVCKVEADCTDLTTTCIDTTCVKIILKEVTGPESVVADESTEFSVSLNAQVRVEEGIVVKLDGQKDDLSINGEGKQTEVPIQKGQSQTAFNVVVEPSGLSMSESYTIIAAYDGLTDDTSFKLLPAKSQCVGNMIQYGSREPQNCPQNKVCVNGACEDFKLVKMLPAEGESLSYSKDYIFTTIANAPARETVQITPNGGDKLNPKVRSFPMNTGDDVAHFRITVSDRVGLGSAEAKMILSYQDNMEQPQTLEQKYKLANCKTGETRCFDDTHVQTCRNGVWQRKTEACAKSEVCLPTTQACGRTTLHELSPSFATIQRGEEITLIGKLIAQTSISRTFLLKPSSTDLICSDLVFLEGNLTAMTRCKLSEAATLGQLISVDVYDANDEGGEKLATSMLWVKTRNIIID